MAKNPDNEFHLSPSDKLESLGMDLAMLDQDPDFVLSIDMYAIHGFTALRLMEPFGGQNPFDKKRISGAIGSAGLAGVAPDVVLGPGYLDAKLNSDHHAIVANRLHRSLTKRLNREIKEFYRGIEL